MVSEQPGIIPQMIGHLVHLHIWGATIFVNNLSDYTYALMMRDLTLDDNLLANTCF